MRGHGKSRWRLVACGSDADAGQSMRVWRKDEQHVSWLDDQPCVTSPDCLAIVETGRGEPLPNRSIDPCHFGFDLAYVPIVERLGYVMVEPLEHVYPGVPTGRCCIQRTPLPQGLAVLLDNYTLWPAAPGSLESVTRTSPISGPVKHMLHLLDVICRVRL